jgi:hypothetical protein
MVRIRLIRLMSSRRVFWQIHYIGTPSVKEEEEEVVISGFLAG